MQRWATAALSCLLACLPALGCVGGQSGTETGGKPDNPPTFEITSHAGGCGCALASRGVLVRATLSAADACSVRGHVEAVLARGPDADADRVQVGALLGGALRAPCGSGLGLSPGDRVLMVHAPGDIAGASCPELLSCVATCPEPPPELAAEPGPAQDFFGRRHARCAAECGARTRARCDAHAGEALLLGEVVVAPWDDTLVLSGSAEAPLSLPRTELSALVDPARCSALLYPLPEGSPLGPGDLGPADEPITDTPADSIAADPGVPPAWSEPTAQTPACAAP